MVECKFCGTEFEDEQSLHIHWGEEHEDQLNSHDEEMVKKAEREKANRKRDKKERRKNQLFFYGGAITVIAVTIALALSVNWGGSSGPANIDISGQPVIGNQSANITVVEFGDYKCPYCASYHQEVIPQLKDQYVDTGQVKYVFINYPFLGPDSYTASQASECVQEHKPDQWYSFHDYLYTNQGDEAEQWADKETMKQYVDESVDGDNTQINQCIDNEATSNAVDNDKNIGTRANVDGTPEVYVNGDKLQQNNFQALKQEIDSRLN